MPAILAKAFRGELVAQDPSNEPASALLARLRNHRATDATGTTKRGSRGRRAGAEAGGDVPSNSVSQVDRRPRSV